MTTANYDPDPPRRTWLAAERTWLAWWRSGIAAAAAAIAVGQVVPEVVGGSRTPYVLLGVGYALLAIAVFVGGAWRHVRMGAALERGDYIEVGLVWIGGLTIGAIALAIGTLLLILIDA
jgi:inner membrane protein YidH